MQPYLLLRVRNLSLPVIHTPPFSSASHPRDRWTHTPKSFLCACDDLTIEMLVSFSSQSKVP